MSEIKNKSFIKIINNYGRLPPKSEIKRALSMQEHSLEQVIIEKWLPYQVERYQFLDADDKLKRVLNQLEISKLYWRINYSIEKADPEEYIKKHGNSLIPTAQLLDFIKQLDKKSGYDKYINEMRNKKDLIGDLKALQYVDLKSHGLESYNKYLDNV